MRRLFRGWKHLPPFSFSWQRPILPCGTVPTGLRIFRFANPTLKRGANNRCAYGADFRGGRIRLPLAPLRRHCAVGSNLLPRFTRRTLPRANHPNRGWSTVRGNSSKGVFFENGTKCFPTERARFPQACWLVFLLLDCYSQEVASASREQSVAACKPE